MSVDIVALDSKRLITDADLVARAVAGTSDSFEELVRRYQKPITGYIFRMIGDYESSLDVSQEVFIKIYNSLHKYCPDYKFSTWLYRIAHNAAVDHLRRIPQGVVSLEMENSEGSFEIQL